MIIRLRLVAARICARSAAADTKRAADADGLMIENSDPSIQVM